MYNKSANAHSRIYTYTHNNLTHALYIMHEQDKIKCAQSCQLAKCRLFFINSLN